MKQIPSGFYELTFTLDKNGDSDLIYLSPRGKVFVFKNNKIIESTVFDANVLHRSSTTKLIQLRSIPISAIPPKYITELARMNTRKNPGSKTRRPAAKRKKVSRKKTPGKRKVRRNCFM